jgi:hypothetical protein
MTDDPRRAFLERFPEARRSTVANLFLNAVRRGAGDVEAVLQAVAETAIARRLVAEKYGNADALDKAREIADGLASHPDEAAAFAEWALAWEAMPAGERQAIKEERAQQGVRHWMVTQPSTERQTAFLARLGWRGPVGDRRQASDLIDRLLRKTAEVS